MKLFENYLSEMSDVLRKKSLLQKSNESALLGSLNENYSNFSSIETLPVPISGPKQLFSFDSSALQKYFGNNTSSFPNITIGAHPDFNDIGFNDHLFHHCTSMFVDIKGSTKLINNYTLPEIRLIKDSLLSLVIHIANFFGGHVHRLQGDGVFLQFVRKTSYKNDSIINALNAASILTHFVKTDLAAIFNQNNIKPLSIRVGIDFGNDDNVLWSYYGIPECKELTTTSLHTDLAAKLQQNAKSNTIMVGKNIQSELDLNPIFLENIKKTGSEEIDYYIFPESAYNQYSFLWQKFLLTYSFIRKQSNGIDLELIPSQYDIECYISDADGSNLAKYFPNSKSIPKGKKILYKLMYNGSLYVKQDFDSIEWRAFNSGEESSKATAVEHDFEGFYVNKTFCETGAAFLGHHYVECKIIREHSQNIRITFPIFVQ